MRLGQGTPKFPLLYFRKASIKQNNLYEHKIILLIRRSGGLKITIFWCLRLRTNKEEGRGLCGLIEKIKI